MNQVNNPTYNKAPDITAAAVIQQPWGHTNLHAVFRDLSIKDGRFIDKSYIGYGIGISGAVKTFGKDNLHYNVVYGDGAGRFIVDGAGGLVTNFTATPTTLAGAAGANSINAKTITEFGAHIGYQHWWLDNLRSTANVGITHSDVNSILLAPTVIPGAVGGASSAAGATNNVNKELVSAHVNLIYNPVAFIDTGIEYVYGHRQTVANTKGNIHAIETLFRVRF